MREEFSTQILKNIETSKCIRKAFGLDYPRGPLEKAVFVQWSRQKPCFIFPLLPLSLPSF